MKAIILAAGYATRLYPLTRDFPKSLLPVADRPILEYTIEKVSACRDIETVYIVTNDKFFNIFKDWQAEYSRRISASAFPDIEIINDQTGSNEERLGSIGDLWLVIETKKLDDDLLIICSDKMFEFSLVDFVDYFKERRAAVNLCFDSGDVELIRNKHGCAVINEEGRIIELQEKPDRPGSSIASSAFYIYGRDLIPLIKEYLNKGGNPDAPGYLARWLCRRVPIYAYLFSEDCLDIGTPESYQEVNRIYSRKLSPQG